ncbi:SOS response-associated peptidase [Phaeobacter sp. Ax4a-4a]|uniref:SOS response-associated peptidase n=1 Tax=Phaeobacter sp. Ax4a-4a TaxID=3112437 RepID=UPI003A85A047
MCGRLGRPDLTWRQLYEMERRFLGPPILVRDPNAVELLPSWNVKPTQLVDIAYLNADQLFSTTARWWFVPSWHRGDVKDWKRTTFNAKIETAADLPSFRNAWKSQRCIIPAAGYYEWTGPKGNKQPWWITTDSNAPALFFAGLYSRLSDDLHTCTILTRSALPQISEIHARSPVILADGQIIPWLSGDLESGEEQDLGISWNGRMRAQKVSPFRRDDDGPDLIEPFGTLF